MSYIEVNDLEFHYTEEDRAIDGISLNIEKGEFVCILGHNGSGKSTLAKLLVGLLQANNGTIKIDGEMLCEKKVDEIRKKMGIVFQNPDNQFVGVTVKDDIAFGLENREVERREMAEKIAKYAKLVSMDKFLERNPEDLSGGEKQRVALAGVLAMEPEVIIFDEATSMLDPQGVDEIMKLILSLKGKKTVIMITHNLNEASVAGRVIVLKQGKIALDGTPREVFRRFSALRECNLDMTTGMKMIEKVRNSNIKGKAEIEEVLWELNFPM